MSFISRRSHYLKDHAITVAALLTLAVVALYARGLQNSFVYDDGPQIINNPFILNPRLWRKIFTGEVWTFLTVRPQGNFYRPLQMFYYWVVFRIAGPNPAVFHAVQFLLYAGAAWVVYRLGCEIIGHELVGLLGAILWVLHPLHVEAVALIAGMPDAGCGFFFLLAFLLFVRAERAGPRRYSSHIPGALAFLPALFFKEMAFSFPLLMLTYDNCFSQHPGASSMLEWTRVHLRWIHYFVSFAIYIPCRWAAIGLLGNQRPIWKISVSTIASSVGLLGQNARVFVWPLGLNPYRVFNLKSSLETPWPWITILVLALAFWFRKRDPQLTFLVAWWGVTMVPCLDINQLSWPQVADRFSFIPSVGLCLALALGLLLRLPSMWARLSRLSAVAEQGEAGSEKSGTHFGFGVAIVAMIAFCWGALTVTDIPHWNNDTALTRYSLRESPQAALLHVMEGDILRFQHGDLKGAEGEYKTALSLNKNASVKSTQVDYESYFELGGIAQEEGRNQEALDDYARATKIFPSLSPAFDALGAFYFPRRDYSAAASYFVRAVEADPQDIIAHIYLGNCWMKLGRFHQAAEEFHAARIVDPTLRQAYVSEAAALEALGDHDGASKVRASYQGVG